jgi:hypothetical protein
MAFTAPIVGELQPLNTVLYLYPVSKSIEGGLQIFKRVQDHIYSTALLHSSVELV